MNTIKKVLYKLRYGNKEREMVSYWKTKDSVEAKVTTATEGHYVMHMDGEKYPFPGYPRGVLLYGPLSPLKHTVKNAVFNKIWKQLEEKVPFDEIVAEFKVNSLEEVFTLAEKGKYDFVPYEKMVPPVKELYRAWTVVEQKTGSERAKRLKEVLCFILQEDDAYRMRMQWIMSFFNPNAWWRRLLRRDPIKDFDYALSLIEHAEVVGDMKERQRLFRRVIIELLKDKGILNHFDLLSKEIDWKKLRLSKADKYFFRAKYFKVDYPYAQY